jgi:hypothetical protein
VLVILALAAVLVFVLSSGRGGGRGHARPLLRRSATKRRPDRHLKLLTRVASYSLASAVSGEAVVARPHGFLVVGGLDSRDVSTSEVAEVGSSSGRVGSAGSLSEPRHDTAAATLGSRVLVFGGGSATELDSVEALNAGGSGRTVGRLPTTRSDLSALTVGGRAYVLGGYDGKAPTGVVLRTADGARFTPVATLPVAFRYAAAVAVGEAIYTFGGELANGQDTDAIQALDVRTDRTRVIAHLPRPLSHASAILLGGRIYVLGGRTREVPTTRILTFNPATGKLTAAGHLPMPVANAAATTAAGVGYLVGGLDAQGATLARVVELRLAEHTG